MRILLSTGERERKKRKRERMGKCIREEGEEVVREEERKKGRGREIKIGIAKDKARRLCGLNHLKDNIPRLQK